MGSKVGSQKRFPEGPTGTTLVGSGLLRLSMGFVGIGTMAMAVQIR